MRARRLRHAVVVGTAVLAGAALALGQSRKPQESPPEAQAATAQPGATGSGAAAPGGASASPSVADEDEGARSVPTPEQSGDGPRANEAASRQPQKRRKEWERAEPIPPPGAQQLEAYEQLRQEALVYEKAAKEYRNTVNSIVRHHYEERRRRVLASLSGKLDIEEAELERVRDDAIARLEAFVAHYSGNNADPSATPDAMFRLAALYEEKARAVFEGDLAPGLLPAIRLYLRIIKEFPAYEEIAAVHYYLGHAYTDSGRLEEGQQAWRSLVCMGSFRVTESDPSKSGILVQPLPQDHPDDYWFRWYQQNPIPLDQVSTARRRRGTHLRRGEEEELAFRDPYQGCEAIPQETEPGKDPRYVAELWWQLGNYHFDGLDAKAGPYSYNRAVGAYTHALQFKQPPLYGVSLYKLAWSYFKQQRYSTATEWFVKLLYYADEQEEKTGDTGADFRAEAYTYIAGSLTYVDFQGPPAEAPYIPRSDVLDVEPDPVVAEEKMAMALDRVQDPAIIPQDRKWTVEIYKALAQEFIEITQNRNAIAALELTLKRFPLDRDAPTMRNRVADLYDELAKYAPEGSAAKADYATRALRARTELAAYVGNTPWTQANDDDAEAIAQAELLVRNGLRRAAADHTNFGRQYYERALERSDAADQRSLIERAIAEYRLAEQAWRAYLEQDSTALDAYESRFWFADARYMVVVLSVAIEQSPRKEEIRAAREAIVSVRDSNEDDKYLQPSAFYLVNLSEQILKDQYRQFERSRGAKGIERRDQVRFVEAGAERQVVASEVPADVVGAVRARDEYNARIPLDQDPERNGLLYAYQAADYYFVYGQFEEARKRFDPLYREQCGKNEWGYRAWEKLISISNLEGNAARSRELADSASCAYNEETRRAEEQIRKPVRQGVAYLDARKLYDEAEKMPAGPARARKWREAAAAYKVALDAAPDRDEAPEAAMNGAFAYKQVGEYDKAIAMYELFIARYGDATTLERLRSGDPQAKEPVPAQPQKYEARAGFLKDAYDALAAAYVLFFNYPKAAETFDSVSTNGHFEAKARREAARQALSLYASLGDRGGMTRARKQLTGLGASAEEIAEADYIVATADLKQWDRFGANQGANAEARSRAQSAMKAFYDAHKKDNAAARYLVRAAYYVAITKEAANARDTAEWRKEVLATFQRWKSLSPTEKGQNKALGTPEASMAAELDYAMIDEALRRSFDYETGHHRYKGTAVEVIKKYREDALDAKRWLEELQRLITTYVSPEWSTVAVARQGSLYDSLRTGLYNTRPPELKMFDAKSEAILRRAEQSDNLDLQEQADALRTKIRTTWRDQRDRELESADRVMVDRYATAVVYARRYSVSKAPVTHAIRRLAFFSDLVGEARMKDYCARVAGLGYQEGMFARMRPGLAMTNAPDGMPVPLPVAAP